MSADKRPNIILIITDQQRYDTIGALGYDYVNTPNLDRLVKEGVSFDNCFITAPSCAPSRGSLFTGFYPHVTSILKNKDHWTHSWVEDLTASGYHCVNIGKMHTYPWETPLGFHERNVVENKDRYLEGRFYFDEWDKALQARGQVKQQREQYRKRPNYRERVGTFEWELPEESHSDVFVGQMACWWLETYPKTEPLFLQIGFLGPHPPYDPTPTYAEPYLEKALPIQAVTQDDLNGQPPAFKQLRQHNVDIDHDFVVHLAEPTREQRHRQRAYYLANWEGREFVFAEHVPDGIYEGPYMTMIRSERWKLVHFVHEDYGQLFDLINDPVEETNLWNDPTFEHIRHNLLIELLNWRVQSGEETANRFATAR